MEAITDYIYYQYLYSSFWEEMVPSELYFVGGTFVGVTHNGGIEKKKNGIKIYLSF